MIYKRTYAIAVLLLYNTMIQWKQVPRQVPTQRESHTSGKSSSACLAASMLVFGSMSWSDFNFSFDSVNV